MAPSVDVALPTFGLRSAGGQPVKAKKLTSGQLEPVASLLQPYSAFPKHIEGPTVWRAEDFRDKPEKWVLRWTEEQIEQLEKAVEQFERSGRDLTEIEKATFPLPPDLVAFLTTVREDLINGKGFTLIKGLPVQRWSVRQSAIAYLGIGTYIGQVVSQNKKGHVLGHVKDIGNDPTQIHRIRIYSTNARQYFHTDSSDIVGLLCLARAREGGESDLVSSHHVWNVLQRERPDVAELLTQNKWYFDRKGETSRGQKEWIQKPVYFYHQGRVISFFDPYYIRSIGRHVEAGLIPGHTKEQVDAIEVFESIAQREALHMILEVGDLQFVTDTHIFHARTAYIDNAPPLPRRHLLRLWLATPESEGGWPLPFPDSKERKRGGIQVDDTPEKCPLEAE